MATTYFNGIKTSLALAGKKAKSQSQILLLTDKKQVKNLPKSLTDKVKTMFENKEDGIFTVYGTEISIIAVICKKESNESLQLEAARVLGASIYKTLEKEKVQQANLVGLNAFDKAQNWAFAEGFLLSQYKFDAYKKAQKESKKKAENGLVTLSDTLLSAKELEKLTAVVQAVTLSKNIVNEPYNQLNAVQFSNLAKQIGKEVGFKVEVLEKAKIETLKMGGILAVNRGSEVPPTFNIFTHKPKNAKNKQPIIFVGKGVMFDTGGYSLKTGGVMQTMKCDMAGGAAVLGTLTAAAALELPYYIIGLVPATDNKISSEATVVDDIITMYDGTTVEVQNTDAEGRLILADALSYAKQYKPELVIDLATLTGAAAAITGPYGIAMMGNTPEWQNKVKVAGEKTYERVAELPFWKELGDLVKGEVSDLKNIGGPVAGASTAGKFLEHFTDYNWIHLDIAGPAFIKENKGYKAPGGTGVGVRLLLELLQQEK